MGNVGAMKTPEHFSDSSLVLITGVSGSGRNTAANVFEDLGWYVADNLPPELIMRMVELAFASESPVERLAIVTDVRSRSFAGNLVEVLDRLQAEGRWPTVLFLDAADDVIVRRYDALRRTHPLQGNDTLLAGIKKEREMLAQIFGRADIVIDSSSMSVHDLRREIEAHFLNKERNRQKITLQSFGFKHGAPMDADFMIDVRFLPNPYWQPELRHMRGTDEPVSSFVLQQDGAQEFLRNFTTMLAGMLPGYRREGKNFITLAVGCTGGHHRSVAIVEALAERFREELPIDVAVVHRDLKRG